MDKNSFCTNISWIPINSSISHIGLNLTKICCLPSNFEQSHISSHWKAVDIFFILLHLGAISCPLKSWSKMSEVCKVVIAHHTLLLMAHKNMLSNTLLVNWHRHFSETCCHHIWETICAIQCLLLEDEEFYYLLLLLSFCGKY